MTGKYRKIFPMVKAIALFINELFTIWTNLKFHFKFGDKIVENLLISKVLSENQQPAA